MRIVNWTKHDIHIYDEDKQLVSTVQPSGYEARIETNIQRTNKIDDIPLFQTIVSNSPYLIDSNDEKHDLPEIRSDTIYIVSGIFRNNFDRVDFWQPGQLIRDESGQPLGCIGLSR